MNSIELKLYKGLWTRKDNGSDREMINDCIKNYRHFTFDENSVILDLGAHIGGFAAAVCEGKPFKSYIGYEADCENFELLEMNVSSEDMYIVNSAVSASEGESIYFYKRNSKRAKTSSSVCPQSINKSMERVAVPNTYINSIIMNYNPTHIKMDIEGAEKDILELWNHEFPQNVQEISLEIHGAKYIQYFEEVIHPKLLEKFDLIDTAPAHGFINKGNDWKHFEHECNSVLFGFDLFYRRK